MVNQVKQRILDKINQLEPEYREVSQYIFDHPELGFEEHLSSKKLEDFLSAHGFKVDAGVAGMPTAFRAVYGSGSGPVIGFVCEYDALPEVGHACGHNIIGTGSATAAIAAASVVDELGGTIVVLGSPCEEGRGAGKQVLMEQGFMDDLDCALMFHPGPFTVLCEPTYAVGQRRFVFHGKEARNMFPEQARSALDAVVQMMVNVNAMKNSLEKGVYANGIITNGGEKTLMIPGLCEAEFALRTSTRPQLDDLSERLDNCAKAAALATGCTVECVPVGRIYDDIWPSHVIVDTLEQNIREMGIPIDSVYTNTPYAATDMGNVSQHIPAIHSILNIGVQAAHHSKEFAAACTGENCALRTRQFAQGLALTAVDLLQDPSLLVKAKEELAQRTGY